MPQVRLIEPDNGATEVGIEVEDIGLHSEVWRVSVYFQWRDFPDPIDVLCETPFYFRFQVDDDPGFLSPEENMTFCNTDDWHCDDECTSYEVLRPNTKYFWRVRLEHLDEGSGPWSEIWSFETMRQP